MKKIQDKNDLKNEIINIRVSSKEKNEITTFAENNSMKVSEFINQAIKEKMETNKLMDSQTKLIDVLGVGFKRSYEPYYKKIIMILNRIDMHSQISIKQQDIFMHHVKVPSTKDELIISPIDHPITEKAKEIVTKDIHEMSARKKELEDE